MQVFKFLDNKYTRTYWKLIKQFKDRPYPTGVIEEHHDTPRSITRHLKLPESPTTPVNNKEHFTLHHLLMKMVEGILAGKMYYAFTIMSGNRTINARMYARIKDANKPLCSGENHPNYGKRGKDCCNYGKQNALGFKHTDKWKKERSDDRMGKCFLTEENKNQIADKLSKTYQITYPNGTQIVIKNLTQFSKDNKLNEGHMYQVIGGKEKHWKGFNVSVVSDNTPITILSEIEKEELLKIPHYNQRYLDYQITYPDGHKENTNNLNDFCRKHNLNSGDIHQVALGNCNHHKGFKANKIINGIVIETISKPKIILKYLITYPDGHKEEITNLCGFCKEHNLAQANFINHGHTKGFQMVKL